MPSATSFIYFPQVLNLDHPKKAITYDILYLKCERTRKSYVITLITVLLSTSKRVITGEIIGLI